ncbi:hypothetical protein [Streptomyces caniscabiei]|uniref:hypothetical protein n=1 Tax=Streptomyces caniscabiei TaxID=2746961 RepID=UPI0029C05861|nr:hypothetical protein [Streptomyces caniscabiei]
MIVAPPHDGDFDFDETAGTHGFEVVIERLEVVQIQAGASLRAQPLVAGDLCARTQETAAG